MFRPVANCSAIVLAFPKIGGSALACSASRHLVRFCTIQPHAFTFQRFTCRILGNARSSDIPPLSLQLQGLHRRSHLRLPAIFLFWQLPVICWPTLGAALRYATKQLQTVDQMCGIVGHAILRPTPQLDRHYTKTERSPGESIIPSLRNVLETGAPIRPSTAAAHGTKDGASISLLS